MQAPISSLTARAQAMITALLVMMAVMGFAPVVQVASMRWPWRFGEFMWRYDTFLVTFSNGPESIILLSIIAIFATMFGYRKAVRAVAITFGLVASAQFIAVLFFLLDYFQVRRLVGAAGVGHFKAVALKTLLVAVTVIVASACGAFWAWRASENEHAGARRQKGEGLVVGQPKGSRPAAE